MYEPLQRIRWITLALLGATVLVALLLLLSGASLIFYLSLILVAAAGAAAWYAHTFIYGKPKTLYMYDVQIVYKDGRSLQPDQVDYAYSNLLYKLAMRHPNSRLGWVIPPNARPLLYTSHPKAVIERDVAEMQDYNNYQVVIREKSADHPASQLLTGSFYHAITIFDDRLFAEQKVDPVSIPDLFSADKLGASGAIINLSLIPKLSALPIGNIALVFPRNGKQRGEESDLSAKTGSVLDGIKQVIVEKSPLVRWYGDFIHVLSQMTLSEYLVEVANIVPFPPVKESTNPTGSRRWLVGNSGAPGRTRVPVILRQKNLVLQQIGGVVNPGVMWAAQIAKTSPETFLAIDFDGSASGFLRQHLDDLPSTSFAAVRVPAENPDYILNLLTVWPGIAEEYHGVLAGVLLRHLQRWIDWILPKESKLTRDSVAAMLQGMVLLTMHNNQNFDLTSLAGLSEADVKTPMTLLYAIRDRLIKLVYQHDLDPFMAQVWHTMTSAGQPINYDQTLAGHEQNASDLKYLNILLSIGTRFISDAGNVILSQSESRYSPAEFANMVFDLSAWEGNLSSHFMEHVLAGAFYILEAKRALGFPDTHLLIFGISSLPAEAQEVVTSILSEYLALPLPEGQYVIVCDRAVVPGYVPWVRRKILSDIYLFRIRDIGGLAEWLAPTRIVESLYTLPKSLGYLMRTHRTHEKVVYQPANIVTGIPKSLESGS